MYDRQPKYHAIKWVDSPAEREERAPVALSLQQVWDRYGQHGLHLGQVFYGPGGCAWHTVSVAGDGQVELHRVGIGFGPRRQCLALARRSRAAEHLRSELVY